MEAIVAHISTDNRPQPRKRAPRTLTSNPTFLQAYNDQELWPVWEEPFLRELNNIVRTHRAWTQITREMIPGGAEILNLIIDLKATYHPNGQLKKRKCRIVLDGSRARKDGQKHFAPTPSHTALMMLIAIAVLWGLKIRDIDIVAAFLYAILDKPMYGRMPKPFEDESGDTVFVKITKNLYGKDDASERFWILLRDFVVDNGYKQAPSEQCLFYKKLPNAFLMFALYVDNIYLCSDSQEMSDEFARTLRAKFEITDEPEASSILGMTVDRFPGGTALTMPKIIDGLIFDCFGDQSFSGRLTPMATTFDDRFADQAARLNPAGVAKMRELVGGMGFLTKVRMDIEYAQNKLATRVDKATEADMAAARQVVQYLGFTRDLPLVFYEANCPEETVIRLRAFSDAAYLVHSDSKSQMGMCASMGDTRSGSFFAKSRKTPQVNDSAASAELTASHRILQEMMMVTDTLDAVGLAWDKPFPLRGDNDAVRFICTGKASGKRMRHVMMRAHFILEQVANGLVTFERTPSKELTPDTLTKPLARQPFWSHMSGLIGESPQLSEKIKQVQRIADKEIDMPRFRASEDLCQRKQREAAEAAEPTRKRGRSDPARRPYVMPLGEQGVSISSARVCAVAAAGGSDPTIIRQRGDGTATPTADSTSLVAPPTVFPTGSTTTTIASVSSVAAAATTTTTETLFAAGIAAAVQAAISSAAHKSSRSSDNCEHSGGRSRRRYQNKLKKMTAAATAHYPVDQQCGKLPV